MMFWVDGILVDVAFEVVQDGLFQVCCCVEFVQDLSGGVHGRDTPFQLARALEYMCCGFNGTAHWTGGIVVAVQFVFVEIGR